MADDDEPVQHCRLDTGVNIPNALEAAGMEYLDVDDTRTIVIYQSAILMVTATEGRASAAQAFDVEFWEEPPDDPSPNPGALVTAFIDELLETADVTEQ
jgi:hypothetical protein